MTDSILWREDLIPRFAIYRESHTPFALVRVNQVKTFGF